MKKIVWLGLGSIGILAAFLFLERGGLAELSPNNTKTNTSKVSEVGQPQEPHREPTLVRNGGSEKLVDVIAEQIAKEGIASPRVADLVSVSQGACASYDGKIKKGTKIVGWAGEYLASACQGFDATQYRGLRDPAPDFLAISLEGGQAAATEAAVNYLEQPDSVLAALQAAMVVGESGKLPKQASLGLSQDQLARAIAAANASVMCPGQNGCAAAHVLAAYACIETTCPARTGYEAALSRNLSPAEQAAATEIRDWLVSLR